MNPPKKVKNLETDTHVFFLTSEFSQWYPSDFHDEQGRKFVCAEQFMMFRKAEFFGDETIALQILETEDPRKQKDLGRQVAGFDKAEWDLHAKSIVKQGTLFKFTQNPDLWDVMDATGYKKIVEAAGYDSIWGIGFGCDDTEALSQPERWGLNWLGDTATEVRDELRSINFQPERGPLSSQKILSMRDEAGQRWLRISPNDLATQLGHGSVHDLCLSVETAPASDTMTVSFKGVQQPLSEPMDSFRDRNARVWTDLRNDADLIEQQKARRVTGDVGVKSRRRRAR